MANLKKKIKKHLKEDIGMFKEEAKEDKKLIKKIDKSKSGSCSHCAHCKKKK